jgi:hypothetical protein
MKTIESYALTWEVHSPSLFVHRHGEADFLVGFNGRTWQIGINNEYRSATYPTRDACFAIWRVAIDEAARGPAVHVSDIGGWPA